MLTLQLTLAARYLWGRKLRTFLTTLAIVFGAWLIFAMNILMTMLKAFEANMFAASGQVDVTITHKTGETFSRNLLNKIRTTEGVRAVSGLLSRTINVPDGFFEHSKVTALTLVGLDPRLAESVRTYGWNKGAFCGPTTTWPPSSPPAWPKAWVCDWATSCTCRRRKASSR